MKIVKVKTCTGTEIFINLEHIDYVNPRDGIIYFTDRFISLNHEGMEKVVELLEKPKDTDIRVEVEKDDRVADAVSDNPDDPCPCHVKHCFSIESCCGCDDYYKWERRQGR